MDDVAQNPTRATASEPPRRAADWRPEIHGLRAVAVSLVVIFHLWPSSFTGGYVGVDVFFVISGFLITAHVLREIATTGTITLSAFWARRIRRLLPAAALVLLVSLVGVLTIVPRSLWVQFLSELAASAAYIQNWVLAGNAVDYFAKENVASPAQHYWSLSVEEQFYIVWPLLILGVVFATRARSAMTRRRALGVTMAVVFVGCLVYSIVATADDQAFAYFATPAHGWEFAGGGLLAWWEAGRRTRSARWEAADGIRSVVAWIGYVLVIGSGFMLTGASPFPGSIALVPVLGVLLVIASGSTRARWSSSFLARFAPVRLLGTISYSLYLWHWPIIVFAGYLGLGAILPGRKLEFLLLAASLLLAWLTTKFVEDPVRFARPLQSRRILSFALAAVLLAVVVVPSVAITSTIVASDVRAEQDARAAAERALLEGDDCFGAAVLRPGNTSQCAPVTRADDLVPLPSAARLDRGQVDKSCWSKNGSSEIRECAYGAKHAPERRIALVGDSHAGQYADALIAIVTAKGWSLTTYLKHSCGWRAPAADGSAIGIQTANCLTWNDRVDARLKKLDFDIIVTSSFSRDFELGGSAKKLDAAAVAIDDSWSIQHDAGAEIVAIRDNPRWKSSPNDCLASRDRDLSTCALDAADYESTVDPQRSAAELGDFATFVDLEPYFCAASTCPAVIGGVTVYRDKNHLTATYISTLAATVAAQLEAALDAD
jgi:peptidoglycan/LPS O-acetylase OafA/YrhL